jgi:Tfp pilus assembly protein PilP
MRAAAVVLIVVLLPAAAFAQAKAAPVKTGQPPAAPPPPAPPAAAGSVAAPAGAAPAAAAGTPQAGAPSTQPPPIPPADFNYQPDGRRDPFLSLLGNAGAQPDGHGKKGDGAGAFTLAEISVRGIVQSKGRMLAMAETPDGKTYLIHAGDKLADGVVKNVTAEGLVFIQDINDPLSVQKQREVRKLLRSLEDAKE